MILPRAPQKLGPVLYLDMLTAFVLLHRVWRNGFPHVLGQFKNNGTCNFEKKKNVIFRKCIIPRAKSIWIRTTVSLICICRFP